MDQTQQYVQTLKNLCKQSKDLFLEKVWVRPRRVIILFVLALLCVSLFFGYRVSSRNISIFGPSPQQKMKEAEERLKLAKELLKQQSLLAGITEERLAEQGFIIDAAKLHSQKIQQEANELNKCSNEFFSNKKTLEQYDSLFGRTLEKVENSKVVEQ